MVAEAEGGGCFHCGQPLPPDPPRSRIEGVERAFCCRGCAAAAEWIRSAGLADYYRLRSEAGERVGEEALDYAAWDREDVQREHSRVVDGRREITLVVDGMRCAACAWLIDRALKQVDGIEEIGANAVTARVRLRWDPARLRLSDALRRLASLGYRPHLAPGEAVEHERQRERRSMLLRLGVAALGTLQAMMFAEALYLDFSNQMPEATRDFFRWIAFLLATPVVFYSGWPFLSGMARELRARHLGMDTLIASSVLLAYLGSLVETLRGGPHVWIDAAVMFVFLLLAARAIETFARQHANAGVDRLARARPALAWRLDAAGRAEQVTAAELSPGDLLRVGVGEAVAADGELLDAGEFDEALLSGESRPVHRAAGDTALAGSQCRAGPVRLRVTRTGQDTRLSHLVRLVEEAQGQRPRLARLADGIASRFVVGLLVSAVAVFALWWQIAPERAFEVMLAVLVVSCPCALSLAVPAALAAAHGALARIGVLGLGSDALEHLAGVEVLLLDKTGTLTEGRPRVVGVEAFPALEELGIPCRIGFSRDSHIGPVESLTKSVGAEAPPTPNTEPAASADESERGSLPVSLCGSGFSRDSHIGPVESLTKSVGAEAPPTAASGRAGEASPEQHALALAGALERGSGHPLAEAFPDPGLLRATELRTEVGRGVAGIIEGQRLRIGRADFAAGREDDGALWLGDGSIALARFELADRPRPEAAATIAALHALGLSVELASGDGEDAVRDVAQRLGVDVFRARQSPEDKLVRLRELQAQGRRVAMLGDGINDAPVLAGADVSIAMGEGAALAHRAADLVLLGGSLARVPQAIAIARRSRAVIRQNLAWAAAYNLIALPIAATGWVTPWMAAVGMALSSLLVTLNALRLARLPAEPKTAAGEESTGTRGIMPV
jgi:P-type Cu2+ transporter